MFTASSCSVVKMKRGFTPLKKSLLALKNRTVSYNSENSKFISSIVCLKIVGLPTHTIKHKPKQNPFYSESNTRYLENIVRDIKEGKAHFAEHELIEAE